MSAGLSPSSLLAGSLIASRFLPDVGLSSSLVVRGSERCGGAGATWASEKPVGAASVLCFFPAAWSFVGGSAPILLYVGPSVEEALSVA